MVLPASPACQSPRNDHADPWTDAAGRERIVRPDDDSVWSIRTQLLDVDALPPGCVIPLGDRFGLLVCSADALDEQARRAFAPPLEPGPSPEHDTFVGVICGVGSPLDADGGAPVTITAIAMRDALAAVSARFRPGVYQPLAGMELAHVVRVPARVSVRSVDINRRRYDPVPQSDGWPPAPARPRREHKPEA
jgi:hypothetical protein